MVKILSQAGNSLADTYDVVGSVAGIDELETRELPIVHEMGGTVFSERLRGEIGRLPTAALNQSATFDISLALPEAVSRILAVLVLADTAARVDEAQVSIRQGVTGREMPIFLWDTADNVESTIRIIENGGAAGDQVALIPDPRQVPNMAFGTAQPVGQSVLVFRGNTAAFGAGTVTLVALVYHAFSQLEGVSSRGLPIPSW